MTEKLYGDADVKRWSDAEEFAINGRPQMLLAKDPAWIDRVLGGLTLSYRSRALRHLALKALSPARDDLRNSVRRNAELFIRFKRGEPISIEYINAGDFQSLLDALCTGDWALVQEFNAVFPAEFDPKSRSIPSSLYIAKPLKALVEGRIEDAQRMLAEKQPSIDPMHKGYPECLRAIAAKDMPQFMEALKDAAKKWRRWAARAERGLPNSVCFLHGAGFAHLAERIIGVRVESDVEDVPLELIR